jgi:hypothetical protein
VRGHRSRVPGRCGVGMCAVCPASQALPHELTMTRAIVIALFCILSMAPAQAMPGLFCPPPGRPRDFPDKLSENSGAAPEEKAELWSPSHSADEVSVSYIVAQAVAFAFSGAMRVTTFSWC